MTQKVKELFGNQHEHNWRWQLWFQHTHTALVAHRALKLLGCLKCFLWDKITENYYRISHQIRTWVLAQLHKVTNKICNHKSCIVQKMRYMGSWPSSDFFWQNKISLNQYHCNPGFLDRCSMILDFKGFLLKTHISECNYPGLNLICVYGKK